MSYKDIIKQAQSQKRSLLNEVESKAVLAEIGIPVTKTQLAATSADAVKLASELGYPVVLKILSNDVAHKSDVGGVKVGLRDGKEVEAAYNEIIANVKKAQPTAHIDGVSVQPQARAGTEVVLGMSKDPQFGPVLMFGLGGILVEILKDVSFRIVPLTNRDAAQMVREIKAFPVLQGYRGMEPADLATLEKAILTLSDFVEKNPEIKEMDLNPVFAYKDGAIAVDARIILEDAG